MSIDCISCGESYHGEELVSRVLRNHLCCLNLTCQADLQASYEAWRILHNLAPELDPCQPKA